MIKKIMALVIGMIILTGCTNKVDTERIVKELDAEIFEVNYDQSLVSNIRVLDVQETGVLYLKVLKEDLSMTVNYQNESGTVENVIVMEGEEVIDSATEINGDFYYSTYIIDESSTTATYRIYKQTEDIKEMVIEGYGDISLVPKMIKLNNKAYVLLNGAKTISNMPVSDKTIYFYNISDNKIEKQIDPSSESETLTTSDHRSGSSNDSYSFSIIHENNEDLSSTIYEFKDNQFTEETFNRIAISQLIKYNDDFVVNYSIMSGEFMMKKLGYIRDGKFINSDLEVTFFEKIKVLEDGLFIYGQAGKHDVKIGYHLIQIENDKLKITEVPLFENEYGLIVPSGYVVINDDSKALTIHYINNK